MKKDISLIEARERAGRLRKVIEKYRYAYHVEDRSLVSDSALDSLKKELFDLEEAYPELVTPDSPTQRIGGKPLESFKKARHEKPMISFNDAFSEDDMKDWIERVENYLKDDVSPNFYCELKIDGLAIELEYENGVFVRGSTRGDGVTGEDVTQNLKTVEAIPLRINDQGLKIKVSKRLIVRGEVFLTTKEFERINRELAKKGEKVYANPRNLAAGSIRQLDPKIMAERKLDSFAYAIVTDLGQRKHHEEHEILKEFGFKTNEHNKLVRSMKEVFVFRNYWEKHREKLAYEIDGVVVAVDDNDIFERAGIVGKAPRAAMAYKFSPKEATTKVLSIEVQVGRTGVLTPVARLSPVLVGGVTVSNSTLHNYDEIARLGLKIGDTVVVTRAGDVIPKITRVLKELRVGKEKDFQMPKRCPIDNSQIVIEGALYRCSNPQCGARLRELLYHFVSRGGFDIRGLGMKIIDRFLDEGLITDAADIFNLKEVDIAVLERFGEKSAENIISEIAEKRRVSLRRFIYALGILHVGEETAQLIAREISNSKFLISKPTHILHILQNFSLEGLQKIPDVGPKVAESIYGWFHEKRNVGLLERLEKAGVKIQNSDAVSGEQGRLTDKSFVFTGSLESISRDDAKDMVRKLGGDVSESVSKKVDCLVAGSLPGLKYEKAVKLGVKIISEKEFLRMIG